MGGDSARPRAVLFDFGGVLVPSPFGVFEALERHSGLPVGFVRSINSRDPDTNAWAQLERGEIDAGTFCELFTAEAAALGGEIDARAIAEPVLRPPASRARVVPEMLGAVHTCRDHGVRTALITNNALPIGDGEAAWVFDTFDAVVQSCVIGSRKPEPAIYRAALDALDVAAEDAVMLDDLGINLKPAMALG